MTQPPPSLEQRSPFLTQLLSRNDRSKNTSLRRAESTSNDANGSGPGVQLSSTSSAIHPSSMQLAEPGKLKSFRLRSNSFKAQVDADTEPSTDENSEDCDSSNGVISEAPEPAKEVSGEQEKFYSAHEHIEAPAQLTATPAPSAAPAPSESLRSETSAPHGSQSWASSNARAVPADSEFPDDVDLLVRQPPGPIRLLDPAPDCGNIATNEVGTQRFDGALFKGKIGIWIRDLPMPDAQKKAFNGKSRQTWTVIQGQFRRRVCVDSLMTGQKFSRPVKYLPRNMIVQPIIRAIVLSCTAVVASNTAVELGKQPAVTFPVALGAQHVHIARPGEEPDISDIRATPLEDVRLMVPELQNKDGSGPAPSKQRQKYFAKPSNRKKHYFEPGLVYTFHIWQHAVNVAKYRLNGIPFGSLVNVPSILNGQPIRFMAFDRSSGLHAWNVEAWHRKLLADARKATPSDSDVVESGDDVVHAFAVQADAVSDSDSDDAAEQPNRK